MINEPKKGKLIAGIILAAMGVTGFGGIETADISPGGYAIVCLLFMAGGATLIFLYVRDRKRYSAQLKEDEARIARDRALFEARQELEHAKVEAELQKMREESQRMRVCPYCGGSSKGDVCDYCGSKF